MYSIINRFISSRTARDNLSTSRNSRRNSRSRSPRMSFYIGSTDRDADNGSSSRRLASSAFHFDLDDLMTTFLQSPRAPPVSQRKLFEIPKINITAELTTTQCSICFDEFKLAEIDIRKLPCTHLYHEKCIFPWLRTSGTCPVCRASLNQPGDEPDPDASSNPSNFGKKTSNFTGKTLLTFQIFQTIFYGSCDNGGMLEEITSLRHHLRVLKPSKYLQ